MDSYWKEYRQWLPQLQGEQIELLSRYFESLTNEAAPLGFIAAADKRTLWLRHILDSLLGVRVILDNAIDLNGQTLYDLGSGAGLPGLIIAICLPELKVHLVDSQQKRTTYLESVVNELTLDHVTVLKAKAGEVQSSLRQGADLVCFRAFQKPLTSLELSLHFVRPGGKVLYWRANPFDTSALLEERLLHLGFETYNFYPVSSPSELGKRGMYIFEFNGQRHSRFPRSLKKIANDPLNLEVT